MNGLSAGARRAWYGVATGLAIVAFVLHAVLANELGRTGVLHEWDVLFSADPTVYVTSFTTGQNTYRWGGRSFVHPNISNALYPIVGVAAASIHVIRPSLPVEIAARRVAYAICPLASAATAAILLFAFGELSVGLASAVALVLLYLVSFSALLFGSIPESYCLCALGFAILFRLAARDMRSDHPNRSRTPQWVAAGTLIASITISNIVSFALVALAVRSRHTRARRAVAWTAGVSGGAMLITIAAYAFGARVSSSAPAFAPGSAGQMSETHGFDTDIAFAEFPAALANTFAPPVPLKEPADSALHQDMRFTLSYHAPGQTIPGAFWRGALLFALLVVAAGSAVYLFPWQRTLVIAALLIVAFNWALHAFYGSEMLLYSQHWAIALLLVFLGLAAGRQLHRGVRRGLLVGLVALCAWNSVVVWKAVIGMLETPHVQSALSR